MIEILFFLDFRLFLKNLPSISLSGQSEKASRGFLILESLLLRILNLNKNVFTIHFIKGSPLHITKHVVPESCTSSLSWRTVKLIRLPKLVVTMSRAVFRKVKAKIQLFVPGIPWCEEVAYDVNFLVRIHQYKIILL